VEVAFVVLLLAFARSNDFEVETVLGFDVGDFEVTLSFLIFVAVELLSFLRTVLVVGLGLDVELVELSLSGLVWFLVEVLLGNFVVLVWFLEERMLDLRVLVWFLEEMLSDLIVLVWFFEERAVGLMSLV